ncbi:MAG: pentapeptide repeat-containing protein [SAR324 cluster bacterium]|nr:pentapeptide repeat-containing protein [SAR324 cluster bacterium]
METATAHDNQGKPLLEVHMGGIYTLEHIARDSQEDHPSIMLIMAAYLRSNSPHDPKKKSPALREDNKAVVKVLRDRHWQGREQDPMWIELRSVNLLGADLIAANLPWARFHSIYLRGAILSGADLSEASLRMADLSLADLSEADLSRANLEDADLTEANLSGANLGEAILGRATLRAANLNGAKIDQKWALIWTKEDGSLPFNGEPVWVDDDDQEDEVVEEEQED